ncbi:alanyl (membrane) aminopeptidase-like b [Misgurnus anguillicaudatus]|uniref:alanyl (membrane) aminopeptidase-like b n=1 Tax=Misgurnus anguillicaudatus TaxID=75329 RepID=UPI003CCFD3DD
MGKGMVISKTLAVIIGIITISCVCGVVLMLIAYQVQIGKKAPVRPPTPEPTTPIPTLPPGTLRLPESLIPESYKVVLQPYFYVELPENVTEQPRLDFIGNSTVRLKCVEETWFIYLHVQGLNVTDVKVKDMNNSKKIEVKNYEIYSDESNFLKIEVDSKLKNGSYYEVFTAFEGILHEDLSGFYLSRYTEKVENEDKERFLVTSQMQPTDARQVFPCFDEPALKAVFNITIIHREESRAISNTKDVESSNGDIDGETWTITTFDPTPVMSTYLLAFTVAKFDYKRQDQRVKMSTYARPEAIKEGHADYAAEIAGKILNFYEKTFELRYPLEKLDQIAVPDFGAGAMENWGLISYQESGLLFDKNTSSNFDKEWVATLIAHELAHQWFGNLVTMRWWNELWLNEGFATYMSYMGLEAAGWDLKDLIVLKEIQVAFQVDSLNSSHPLSLPENEIQTYSDIIDLFDDITYSKGAAVLRMLSKYIGEEAFMNGIKAYLSKFQYMNPVSTDLWECLDKEKAKDVAAFMSTWIEQVGYPVITIDTRTGDVYQEQFLLKQTEGHGIPWHVYIMHIKSDKTEDEYLLTQKGPVNHAKFKVTKDVWLLANINCYGFYRVNYDEGNWNKLLMQLESDHHEIPVINRGQLIDDAFNLARAGRLNVTIGLSLTKYMKNETEYIPWESALRNLDYFILMFDRSEVYGPIKKYLRDQIEPLYESFQKYNGSIPESHTEQYCQVTAISVACSNGLPDCQTMALNLFRDWRDIENGTNEIHPNLRRDIYCSAIAAGDEEDWEFAWEEYQRATVSGEKDKLRYALSCTKEIWLLNRYLQYTLDPTKIRKMDVVSTINYIAKNVAGQPLAWNFVRGKWFYLTQEYGAGVISFSSLIDSVTKRFSTDYELQQLQQLQREQEENGQELASRTLEQVIERTEANIKWVNENKQIVMDWFTAELNR